MTIVRHNAFMLALLKEQDKGGKQLIDLDTDDYLNPERTLFLYENGYDMQFLVDRVGGDIMTTYVKEETTGTINNNMDLWTETGFDENEEN